MQKKWIAACLAGMLMMTPVLSFAEDYSLDESYMDFMFGKLENADEDKKKEKIEDLRTAMHVRSMVLGLKRIWKSNLSEDTLKELEEQGIDDDFVSRNIDNLAEWDSVDRVHLVEYAALGKMSKVKALNDKYASIDEDDDTDKDNSRDDSKSKSGGGSGGSGGSGNSTDQGKEVITVEDESVPEGTIKLSKVMKQKGFLSKALEVKNQKSVDGFEDMKTHWSKDYVDFFVVRGVLSGKSESAFDPNATVTNAELLTMLSKIIIEDKSQMSLESAMPSDVDESAWYAEYVAQMTALGISNSDEEGRIQPNSEMKRQDVVKVLINALDAMGLSKVESSPNDLAKFEDAKNIKPENFNAMHKAVALGIIKGMGDGRLAPDEDVTRGQIAVMLKQFHDYIISKLEEVSA